MKAAKETEALTAEQHFRESIRVARTTRELLKRFAAAHRWLEQHKDEDHREKTIDIPETTKSSRFSDEDVHEDLAINKECFLMAIQDREVPSFRRVACPFTFIASTGLHLYWTVQGAASNEPVGSAA